MCFFSAFIECFCKKHPFDRLKTCSGWKYFLWFQNPLYGDSRDVIFINLYTQRSSLKHCSGFSVVKHNTKRKWLGSSHYLLLIRVMSWQQTFVHVMCWALRKAHVLTWRYCWYFQLKISKRRSCLLFSNSMQYYLVSQNALELTKTGNFTHVEQIKRQRTRTAINEVFRTPQVVRYDWWWEGMGCPCKPGRSDSRT